MGKDSQLEQARERGYIIGPSSTIDLLQKEFYEWCGNNGKPYIAITTRRKYCHFSVDTPSAKLRLNENGITAIKDLMEQNISTRGTYSIGGTMIFHDNVPIQVSDTLAKGILGIFKDKENLETKI